MSGMSEYAEAAVLNHILGISAFTMPATVALALTTVVPTNSNTGATITEPTYTGYARLAITSADWAAIVAGDPSTISNAVQLAFANCTAGTSTIVGFAICDSLTTGAGNMLLYGSVPSTVISSTQTPATLAAGALEVTLA